MHFRDGLIRSQDIWVNNPSVVAATRVGLWRTCLDLKRDQYVHVSSSLPWLGPQCVSHEHKVITRDQGQGMRETMPQWFKVNIDKYDMDWGKCGNVEIS